MTNQVVGDVKDADPLTAEEVKAWIDSVRTKNPPRTVEEAKRSEELWDAVMDAIDGLGE